MRILGLVILVGLLCLVAFQVFSFWSERGAISDKFEKANAELGQAKIDQEKLEKELEYLANPVNLEKELRARFNLRGKNEKLIIVVPTSPASASAPASASGQ